VLRTRHHVRMAPAWQCDGVIMGIEGGVVEGLKSGVSQAALVAGRGFVTLANLLARNGTRVVATALRLSDHRSCAREKREQAREP